ncbi:MAG: DUF1801 domain-containing protein [Porphyrobacter sp.]|nr:DUF1801 domain-containing protein [Porphyrobacter sp.]
MAKAELKTKPTEVTVDAFIAALPDERRREEARALDAIYRRVTGLEPKMWGPSIVGYGSYDYRYESGHSGTMCKGGFSPRKAALTLYLSAWYGDRQVEAQELFARLGKHSTGKACLYVKRLEQVDAAVLEQLVALSWERMGRYFEEQVAAFRDKS